jgi:transcription elongation factor S-II
LKPALIKAIETGEVKSQDVAFMTHQEFAPEKWSELIDKKTKRDDSKFKEVQQSSTNLYACKKCGSRNCSYYELQIRSADEPATIFLTCIDCGKRWKI